MTARRAASAAQRANARRKAALEADKRRRSEAAKRGARTRAIEKAAREKAAAFAKRSRSAKRGAITRKARTLASFPHLARHALWGTGLVKHDGSLGIFPSLYREVNASDRAALWKQLALADLNGRLKEEMMHFAVEQRTTLREVYSFFFSP